MSKDTFKDLALRALSAGAVDSALVDGSSQRTIRRAAGVLRDEAIGRGDLADKLEALAVAGSAGRKPPQAGEERVYSVQNIKGVDFVRIPVATLGAKKGDSVSARFVGAGGAVQITLSKA